MKRDIPHRVFPRWLALASCALAACSTLPEPRVASEDAPLRAMLAYYGSDLRGTEAPRGGAADDPYLRMRQAIRFGQSRTPDLPRALNLLEGIMKSEHPAAPGLAPLAHLLHEQYGERWRLEQRLHESQRQGEELQEKLDALSAIERSLPARPPAAARKPARGGR